MHIRGLLKSCLLQLEMIGEYVISVGYSFLDLTQMIEIYRIAILADGAGFIRKII